MARHIKIKDVRRGDLIIIMGDSSIQPDGTASGRTRACLVVATGTADPKNGAAVLFVAEPDACSFADMKLGLHSAVENTRTIQPEYVWCIGSVLGN